MLKKIGLSVLFLFLVIAFLSWQSGTYGEYCNEVNASEKNCASYNLAPFIFIEVAEFFHRFESVFVVLSTIAIAWFTYELRRATVGLKDSTDKLWLAGEKQLAITQRAYIVVEPQGVIPLRMAPHTVYHVSIKNVGHLPAKNVRWQFDSQADANGQRTDFSFDETRLIGSNYWPPDTVMNFHANDALDESRIAGIQGNSMYYFVWGIVFYDDGFGNDKFTRFCHVYSSAGLYYFSGGKHDGQLCLSAESARYHHHGNEAD
jgi:hypothetical protein